MSNYKGRLKKPAFTDMYVNCSLTDMLVNLQTGVDPAPPFIEIAVR